MNKIRIFLFFVFISAACFSCKKDSSLVPDNTTNPNNQDTSVNIGSFSVTVLTRTATGDSIKWTRPSVTGSGALRFKVYLANNLLAQNLTDTNYIFSVLIPDSAYSGRVVAYTSVSDSVSVAFSLPRYTVAGPTDPYGYLRGYYKVTEVKTDYWTGGEVYNSIFTGRLEIYQDTLANFLQLPRNPSVWWQFDFISAVIRPDMGDSILHASSLTGQIVNPNTVRIHYMFGGGWSTVFVVEQLWEKLQNPADSAAYSFQWPADAPGLIKTVAGNNTGNSTVNPSGDGGPATAASLADPYSVYVDPQGDIFIGDAGNGNKTTIRKVNATSGIINLFAGNYTTGFSGDGGPATAAQLSMVKGMVVDGNGNLYVSDGSNNRIRKIDASGTITTIAGTGQAGYSGDGGPASAAKLWLPDCLKLDAPGNNLFVCDGANRVVRKINLSTGIISTVAGTGTIGSSGVGGPAIAAQLYSPTGLEVDASGNLYIADFSNYVIYKVDAAGILTVFAGTLNVHGFSGDGGMATAATFNQPAGITMDAAGNFYVSDFGNHRIRKITQAGIISTVAGTGSDTYVVGGNIETFNNDYGPALQAVIRNPGDIFCRGNALYVIDLNRRVRKIFL